MSYFDVEFAYLLLSCLLFNCDCDASLQMQSCFDSSKVFSLAI